MPPPQDALPSPDRLLTDRGSYIAYLESQLERVSAACLTVTSFDERLEQAVSAIRCLEEKTINLARLVAVTQQFAEQQEAAQRESAAEVLRRLRGVEARLEELEEPARAAAWEAKLRAGGCAGAGEEWAGRRVGRRMGRLGGLHVCVAVHTEQQGPRVLD